MKDRKLLNIELGRISAAEYKELPSSGLVVVLDNIRSAHNVGSAFRTADSFGIDKVFLCGIDKVILCGISAVPPSAEIHKSALGAEDSVPWEHVDDTLDAVARLQADGFTVIAVEQTVHSLKLGSAFRRDPGCRYALVFGNEVSGVRQDVVDASDFALEIPQYGTKHSLNVSVSIGVVLWEMVR